MIEYIILGGRIELRVCRSDAHNPLKIVGAFYPTAYLGMILNYKKTDHLIDRSTDPTG